jgi:dethiobiotin synthetase
MEPGNRPRGFFITGTDTGVGKTLVACALLRAYAAQGLRVAGMKPVASGALRTARGLANDDVDQLSAAGNVHAPAHLMNPYCFEPAVAPHVAAEEAGRVIEVPAILQAFRDLAMMADLVVVEGVGGFKVPLNGREDTSDLASALGLPVVMVVGMRLGCLNHALLTAQAIDAAHLRLAGWVANRLDAAMLVPESNVAALAERLRAPLLADIPLLDQNDPARVARMLRLAALN